MNEALAQRLAEARRHGTLLEPDAQTVPSSIEAAYEISARNAALLGEGVAGWKLGISPEGIGFAAPMLSAGQRQSGSDWRRREVGVALLEIELAFRLGRDLPPGRAYSGSEIADACASALVGLELLESRFGDGSGLPFTLALSDDLSNAGYVSGAERVDFGNLGDAVVCRIWQDEALVGEKLGIRIADLLAPVVAFARNQNAHLGGLKAGQIITTGALLPPLRLERASRISGEIEGIGKVRLNVI